MKILTTWQVIRRLSDPRFVDEVWEAPETENNFRVRAERSSFDGFHLQEMRSGEWSPLYLNRLDDRSDWQRVKPKLEKRLKVRVGRFTSQGFGSGIFTVEKCYSELQAGTWDLFAVMRAP